MFKGRFKLAAGLPSSRHEFVDVFKVDMISFYESQIVENVVSGLL